MTADEQFQETFSIGEAAQLLVSNVKGSIRIVSEERDSIQVTAIKRVEACKHPERTEVQLLQQEARVVARTRVPNGMRRRRDSVCPVDYAVHIPPNCDVTLKQVQGIIHVEGVSGRLDVNAVNGNVELYEIDGHTRVRAVSATIDGRGWTGRARLNTVSGPVSIEGAKLSRLRANTVSADLSLETTLNAQGRYDFKSVSGDVVLYIPPDHGVDSRGRTVSGHLQCDLPHAFSQQGRGSWQATVNGGGPPLRFNSISGDLRLRAASAA